MFKLLHFKNGEWQKAWDDTPDLALAIQWAKSNTVSSCIVRENGTRIYYF